MPSRLWVRESWHANITDKVCYLVSIVTPNILNIMKEIHWNRIFTTVRIDVI